MLRAASLHVVACPMMRDAQENVQPLREWSIRLSAVHAERDPNGTGGSACGQNVLPRPGIWWGTLDGRQ